MEKVIPDSPLKGIQAGPIVDRACYTDQAIFEIERTAIFEKTWLCIGHASEFKKPGDFRRAEIAGQPILIVKQADGELAVLYNSCRHRGTLVEAGAEGNRTCFRCPYHHWEYNLDGTLKHVPDVRASNRRNCMQCCLRDRDGRKSCRSKCCPNRRAA